MASTKKLFERRKARCRFNIRSNSNLPRLSVFRSGSHIYAQIIDDIQGRTIAASSSVVLKVVGSNKEAAAKVGTAIAEAAKKSGIENVVFDKGGYSYHGRVQVLADAARAAGLKF
jgi:large subunit ribosomal protein L18